MRQGLIGTHIATNIPVEIPLNGKEMQLAKDKGPKLNESWSMMCSSVLSRTGMTIEGDIEIDFIVVDGSKRRFH